MPKGPKGEKRPADVIGAQTETLPMAAEQLSGEFLADEGILRHPASLARRGAGAI
jgi:hypothetical protein